MMLTVMGFLVTLAPAILLVVLLPTVAWDQTRPAPPPNDQLAAPGHPGWLVDARSGCWVWIANPPSGMVVTWSGTCGADGRAAGHGVVEYRWEAQGQQKVDR